MTFFISIFSELPVVLIFGMKLDWSGAVTCSPIAAINDLTA